MILTQIFNMILQRRCLILQRSNLDRFLEIRLRYTVKQNITGERRQKEHIIFK